MKLQGHVQNISERGHPSSVPQRGEPMRFYKRMSDRYDKAEPPPLSVVAIAIQHVTMKLSLTWPLRHRMAIIKGDT